MRTFLAAVLAPLLAFAVLTQAPRASCAGDPAPKPVKLLNEKCPLTGEEVNPEVTTVWNGLEVRFCCEGCIPDFVKDPAKYLPRLLKDLAAQRDAAEKKLADAARAPAAPVAPAAPPVPPVPPVPAAPSAPAAPAAPAMPVPAPAPVPPAPVAAPALIDLGNAMCPVSTRPVKEGLYVEYHGMKVRLCCKGCTGGFNADPAKGLTWLRQDPVVAKRIDAAEAAWAAKSPAPAPVPSPAK